MRHVRRTTRWLLPRFSLYRGGVYSPHSYGPAIYDGMGYFQDETFPKNMPKVWDEHAR